MMIDQESVQEKDLTLQDVLNGITLVPDDVVDGFLLTTDIPGFSRVSDFMLCSEGARILSKELCNPADTGAHCIIQIHHWECDCTDDYLAFELQDNMDTALIFDRFKAGLQKYVGECNGDRLTWVNMAKKHVDETLGSRSIYVDKCQEDHYLDLDWSDYE